jgi:hypothetical protein
MAAAWTQVGDVLVVNGRIRAGQLAREVGHALQIRHLDPPAAPPATVQRTPGGPSALISRAAVVDRSTLAARLATADPVAGRSMRLTAPAHARVTALTTVPAGLGPVPAGLAPAAPVRESVGFTVAASQIATAPVSPTMRRLTRPGARLVRTLFTPDQPPPDGLLVRMGADVDPVTAAPPKAAPVGLVTAAALDALLHPGAGGLDPVDRLPTSADFVLRDLDDPVRPTPGGPDSAEATRFKAALRELYQGMSTAISVGKARVRLPLNVVDTTASVLDALRSDQTVPKTLLGAVALPERLQPFAEGFIEAMAYPVFDLPTLRPLLDLGPDAFVPNLDLLPANSITLLENNREFIEAYLAGLNHEMARELLWREYPTDQRGTPFRQFWDPRVALPQPEETAEDRRERLYDIPPMHRWPLNARLGDNDQRGAKDDLVLVVRGELLKKYPTTAVYAQRAVRRGDGARVPVDLTDGMVPPPELVRLPRYEAKVEPDLYLLGFDLSADEARGTATDPGWFFVLKERPGDPRFGVDEGPATRVEVWNDLTWDDVDPQRRGFLALDAGTAVPLATFDGSDDDREKKEQRGEDENLPLWYSGLSSADLAYILFQVPVMVAVHAQEMLPR